MDAAHGTSNYAIHCVAALFPRDISRPKRGSEVRQARTLTSRKAVTRTNGSTAPQSDTKSHNPFPLVSHRSLGMWSPAAVFVNDRTCNQLPKPQGPYACFAQEPENHICRWIVAGHFALSPRRIRVQEKGAIFVKHRSHKALRLKIGLLARTAFYAQC
jgi:hypothetical protein